MLEFVWSLDLQFSPDKQGGNSTKLYLVLLSITALRFLVY